LCSAECFSALNFLKICLSRSKWCPRSKVKFNVVNLSNKAKMLVLLKGGVSLVEVGHWYGKNEANICSSVLIIHLEPSVFLQWLSPWNQIPLNAKGLLYTYKICDSNCTKLWKFVFRYVINYKEWLKDKQREINEFIHIHWPDHGSLHKQYTFQGSVDL
jgi:hypothetical protein